MTAAPKRKKQIHAVYSLRGNTPKASYELDQFGDTMVPLRGEMLVRHIPAKRRRMVCQKCGLPFWSIDNTRLYCLFCMSWISKEPDRRRQKTRQANINKGCKTKMSTR